MKKYPLPLLILLLFACKKNNNGGGNNNGNTSIIPSDPTPVTADLAVYCYNNNQTYNPLYVLTYNGTPMGANAVTYMSASDGFFANSLPLDKYLSHIQYQTSLVANNPGFDQYRSFDVPGTARTYVGFKYLNFALAGNIKNAGPATTLNLDGNGTLSFPVAVFNSMNIDMNYNIYVNYLDPTATDFAASLPTLPFADARSKRWFLDSYGVYQIRPVLSYCNCNIITPSDLFAKPVTMQMPIPAGLQADAPDSVEAWHMNAQTLTWEQNGYAYKKNGTYEKNITQHGVWNFARPLDAAYVTIQLRSTNDISLPNTRFVIKVNNNEVAEGRTDMEGDALVLVPANKPLAFNVINDHYPNYDFGPIVFPDLNIGSMTHTSTKKIVLPDRPDLGTLEGTVYNCNGSSFGNGSVIIAQTGAKDNYVVPVVNGKFYTGNWVSPYAGQSKLSFHDAGGALSFEVNTYLASHYDVHPQKLKENFYSCPDAAYLYCNYQIDTTHYSINGDTAHASPVLTQKFRFGVTGDITIQDGNKSISFTMWVPQGEYTGQIGGLDPLKVNNVDCTYDPNGRQEITIYRNDITPNGFMEGWFGIDYLDAGNTPHKITGNFRVRMVN